ncbi:unnamed protein product [Periconia digitata]|uniref:ASST-domain-containing protein n=1 Tax=Periconia digitata TaxID=1303443 RepID=A0A9W4UVX2_9PLEO|nr:unnamed protein product [Periconia digitata]
MLNQSYDEIAHLQVAGFGDNMGDLHEFYITEDDTALVAIYHPIPWDLTSMGGIEDGWLMDSSFQELDIETGDLIFEWNATDHVGVNETYVSLAPDDDFGRSAELAWDWFHINSVMKDENGDYIISGRTMSCVYKISGEDGHIIWRLHGKRSDFEFESSDAEFHFQHDARWLNEKQTRMTVWDNGDPQADVSVSRGLLLDIDQDARTASLVQDFTNENRTFGEFMGSVQAIDASNETTNFMLGFGSEPYFAEVDRDDNVLLSVQLAQSDVTSYRIYKQQWQGKPSTDPDMFWNGSHVYLSWNGATDVETWEVYTGANETSDMNSWTRIASARRTGFETTIDIADVDNMDTYVRGKALNSDGDELGRTKVSGDGEPNQRSSTDDDGEESGGDESGAASMADGRTAGMYFSVLLVVGSVLI